MVSNVYQTQYANYIIRLVQSVTPSEFVSPPNTQADLFFKAIRQRTSSENLPPLQYRELVILGHLYKNLIVTNRISIALLLFRLKKMRKERKLQAQKNFLLVALIGNLWDRSRNLFACCRWKTTDMLGSELKKELANSAIRSAIEPPATLPINLSNIAPQSSLTHDNNKLQEYVPDTSSDIITPQESPRPVTTPSAEIPQQQETDPLPTSASKINEGSVTTGSKGKATPSDNYRNGTLSRISKQNLFTAFQTIDFDPKRPQLNRFDRFLCELGNSTDTVLEGIVLEGIVSQAILDMFLLGDKEAQTKLALWLKGQPTMNAHLCIESLAILNQRFDDKPTSLFAIIQLLKLYQEKLWNLTYPPVSAVVNKSVHILLREMPNDNLVIELVSWLAKDRSATKELFNGWLDLLEQKEFQHSTSLIIPLRDILEKMHPEWPRTRAVYAPRQNSSNRHTSKLSEELAKNPDENPSNAIARSTLQKQRSLTDYRNSFSGKPCSDISRSMVFKDLNFLRRPPSASHTQTRAITSVEDLLVFINQNESTDLTEQRNQCVILDVFCLCKNALVERTLDWVCDQPTFQPDFFLHCLNTYVINKDNTTNQFDGLEKLLLTCSSRNWFANSSIRTDKPIVIEAIKILLNERPNGVNTSKIVAAIHPFLNKDTKDIFIAVFNEKKRHFSTLGKNSLSYTVLELLQS